VKLHVGVIDRDLEQRSVPLLGDGLEYCGCLGREDEICVAFGKAE